MHKTARYATRYPELFACYWGDFGLLTNPAITPGIIENRNRFVEEFAIVATSGLRTPGPYEPDL